MSKFFIDDATTRIELDADHWVDIKSEMSIGDWEKFTTNIRKIELEEQAENRNLPRAERRRLARSKSPKMKLDISSGDIELLEINIVEWNLDVELTRTNISRLRANYAQIILDKINDLNEENRPLAGEKE